MTFRRALSIPVLLLAFATVSCSGAEPAPTPAPTTPAAPVNEEPAVKAAADQFYSALNAMFTGNVDPMLAVWSHADDVTYMGPMGGFQVGWTEILKIWQEQAALKLGGSVTPTGMRIIWAGDLATTHNLEEGENTNAQGKVEKVSIRVTNVFRKEGGAWKMVGHHTDLLPFLVK